MRNVNIVMEPEVLMKKLALLVVEVEESFRNNEVYLEFSKRKRLVILVKEQVESLKLYVVNVMERVM